MRRIKFSLLYLSFLFIFTLVNTACGGGSSSSKQGGGSGGSSGSAGSGTSGTSGNSGNIVEVAVNPCADNHAGCHNDDEVLSAPIQLPTLTIRK